LLTTPERYQPGGTECHEGIFRPAGGNIQGYVDRKRDVAGSGPGKGKDWKRLVAAAYATG